MSSFYNSNFAGQRRNRLSQYQTALQRLMQRRQAADATYGSGVAGVEQEKPGVFRGLLNGAAGRGMAFSTGYGQQVSDANTAFSQRLAGLSSTRNAELASANLDESNETNSYNYDLGDLDYQQSVYDAQQQQALVASLAAQRQQEANLALTQAKTAQAKTAAKKKSVLSGMRRRL